MSQTGGPRNWGPTFTLILDEVKELEMGKAPVRVLITGAAGEAMNGPEVGLVVLHLVYMLHSGLLLCAGLFNVNEVGQMCLHACLSPCLALTC